MIITWDCCMELFPLLDPFADLISTFSTLKMRKMQKVRWWDCSHHLKLCLRVKKNKREDINSIWKGAKEFQKGEKITHSGLSFRKRDASIRSSRQKRGENDVRRKKMEEILQTKRRNTPKLNHHSYLERLQ